MDKEPTPDNQSSHVLKEMQSIQSERTSLRRQVEGDTREGWKGLRGRIEELENQADVLSKDLERMTWRYNALSTTVKWLGPSGVMLIIAFIGYIWQTGAPMP